MRPLYLLLLLLTTLYSCKDASKPHIDTKINEEAPILERTSTYPKALNAIFKAHGGLSLWNKQRTLVFTIPKPNNPETHTTDLKSRKDKIVSVDFEMGFDGKAPWSVDKNSEYKGNVEFYHNLMFYFYAMPFVLADEGITYGETTDLIFEDKAYPGIKISYGDGVGTSPKDEYFIHFDPDTHHMQWLGYTVTYSTGEKSDNVRWIRYDDWMSVDGLSLPKSISWYNYEGRQINDRRSTVVFENVQLSTVSKEPAFYARPENGKVFVKEE